MKESDAARIEEAQPVAWIYTFDGYQEVMLPDGVEQDNFKAHPEMYTPLYLHPAADAKDAERYRWLRDTMSKSVGGGIEVNDAALVYEESEPKEQVRVYWYPDTPVSFYEIKAETLDAAIDAAMKGGA